MRRTAPIRTASNVRAFVRSRCSRSRAARCDDALTRVDLVANLRVLGARVEVDGEPERASPAPGETAAVRWLVADRRPEPPLGWAFSVCAAAPPGGSLPSCAGEPFATATNDVPAAGEPRIDFVVPDDVSSGALAVFGVVCPDSEPSVEAGAFDCRGPGGRLVSLDFVLESAGVTNTNPDIDPEALTLDGASIPEGLDCATLPTVGRSSSHTLSLALRETDRDAVEQMTSVDPPKEELQVSHFTTAGSLERAFTVFDASDEDLRASVSVEGAGGRPARRVRAALFRRAGFARRLGLDRARRLHRIVRKENDMDLVSRMSSLADFGARWVLWLLFALSVIAVAIIIERAVLFFSSRDDVSRLRRELRRFLDAGDEKKARQRLEESPSYEARVAIAGLEGGDAKTADERMLGERELARLHLERRLAILGTLGNNAPFIGLLGTVIGIVRAFRALEAAQSQVSAGLMAEIGEALIATAIGLIVALPAVAAFNAFQRVVRSRLGQSDVMRHEVLSYLRRDFAASAAE